MLPERYVEQIFTRLLVRYGAAWASMWRGLREEDMVAVRADWAETLAGFSGSDIRYALDNLPSDRPPNALQFRDLCRRAPSKPMPQLPAPPADPERVRAALARLNATKATLQGRRPS